MISGVTLIPLASCAEAKSAIESLKRSLEKGGVHPDSDTSDEEEQHPDLVSAKEEDEPSSPDQEKGPILATDPKNSSSIAQDVISKKGAYGRFAERWFSRKGWSVERRRSQGMSTSGAEGVAQSKVRNVESDLPPNATAAPEEAIEDSKLDEQQKTDNTSVTATLAPKLLRTTRLLFNSQSFYFSYDHDLTRRLSSGASKASDVPLCKRVDPLVSCLYHRLRALKCSQKGSFFGISIWPQLLWMLVSNTSSCQSCKALLGNGLSPSTQSRAQSPMRRKA